VPQDTADVMALMKGGLGFVCDIRKGRAPGRQTGTRLGRFVCPYPLASCSHVPLPEWLGQGGPWRRQSKTRPGGSWRSCTVATFIGTVYV